MMLVTTSPVTRSELICYQAGPPRITPAMLVRSEHCGLNVWQGAGIWKGKSTCGGGDNKGLINPQPFEARFTTSKS